MSKQSKPNISTERRPQPPRTPKKDAGGLDNHKLAPKIHNRRARFDYFILETIECGIELVGSEVKSVRQGKVQLGLSFAKIRDGQVHLLACHIDEYVEANQLNHDPTRTRRLLLHRREIRRLEQKMHKTAGGGGGVTLVPLEMYFRRGYAKVLLGIAKGKKQYDKRQSIKEREDKRNMEKALRRG